MSHPIIFWTGFHVLLALLLILDLGVLRRKDEHPSFKKSLYYTFFWIAAALLFNVFIYFSRGSEAALEFFTGYLVEKSLSVDNLFVFLLIFTAFKVSQLNQHKILFWGILGAIVFRICFILAGVALIHSFDWMLYFFGAFLVLTAIKFITQKEGKAFSEDSKIYRFCKKYLPFTESSASGKFIVKESGIWKFTPLFLIHLLVEFSDLLFAMDSIPAVFAITTDPFLVYTSNIFAILGLRSLYFCLHPFLEKLKYFKFGLAAILLFVGLKMLTGHFIKVPTLISMAIILLILGITTILSVRRSRLN